jgi:hypothetical protein
MVEICQTLDQLHLFSDGNIRTIIFLTLNKMLLDAGYKPVIWENPNVFDAYSVVELKEMLEKKLQKIK